MVNKYQENLYFHYESLIELLASFYVASILEISLWKKKNKTEIKKKLISWYADIKEIIKATIKNGCKVYPTIEAIHELKSK